MRRWLVAIAAFTAAAVLFTSQVRVDYAYAGRRLSWSHAFGVALINWELWALLAPLVILLADRFPLSRRRLGVALAVHLPASLVFAMVKIATDEALVQAAIGPGRMPVTLLRLYITLLTYWAIVAATRVAEQQRVARERELRGAHLEAELARAQVEALKMQLHPHFLFNTLNTISGLMREDVEAADVMLAQLSELLRRTLETEGRQEVPLAEEIQWLRTYLAIQQTRYGPRLGIAIAVPAACERALVPTLILQPLVENAIRHGFSAMPGPGSVRIDASASGGRLRVDVTDEGPGAPEPLREGYGLRNTRSRLRALYDTNALLVVERRRGAPGTLSRIELPLREAAEA